LQDNGSNLAAVAKETKDASFCWKVYTRKYYDLLVLCLL